MDDHRRSTRKDHSFRTDERSSDSPSSRSSNASTVDSVSQNSKSHSEQSSRSLATFSKGQKRTERSIPSSSLTKADSRSRSTMGTAKVSQTNERVPRRPARPLGTCVRRCDRCRKLKHVLLAECGGCYRMVDVDLKDCKCHTDTSMRVMDDFRCSTCHCELTLDDYVICANRACQTLISTLLDDDATEELPETSRDSLWISHVFYPNAKHRTLCVQVNTCLRLSPLRSLLPLMDEEDTARSSNDSRSSIASDTSHSMMENLEDLSASNIQSNKVLAVNWNQPMKSVLQSEDEHEEKRNMVSALSETPKSPRCRAIMNVPQRRDRLSVLLPLPSEKICQTHLTCLTDSDRMIRCETLEHVTIRRTGDPTKTDRQIQVNTLQDRPEDEPSSTRDRTDSSRSVTNDHRIVAALTDRDGKEMPRAGQPCSKHC